MAVARTTFGVHPEFLRMARGDPQSATASVIRESLGDVAQKRFENIIPQHFDESAYSKWAFAYRSRTPRYIKAKRRRYGHNRPMVQTGRMQRELLGQPPTLRSKMGGRTIAVVIRSPWSRRMNLWSGKRKGPNFEQELHARTYAEQNAERVAVQALIERRMPEAIERDQAAMATKTFTA